MEKNISIVTVMLLLFLSVNASAFDLRGESKTYLQVRENADDDTIVPFHEYLDFSLQKIANKDISFYFGGWVRQDLTGEESFNKRHFSSDLQYAYLSFKKKRWNALLNVGRVIVTEGVASSEVLDGIYARSDLKAGVGISAYGGSPVEKEFNDRGGNYVFGGRLFHEIPNLSLIGFSYLQAENSNYLEDQDGDDDSREEVGVDIWLVPINKVEISGWSRYNADTSGWMEHAYYLTIGPFDRLRLSGEISYFDYEDFFASVTNSAFAFQPGILNPDEDVLILGGQAEYALLDTLFIAADYKNYNYDIADSADYFGGGLRYLKAASWGAGISFHRMDGDTDTLQYYEFRTYGYKKFSKGDITLDFFNVHYDEEINNEDNAFTASLALGYDIKKNAQLAGDLSYSKDPEFDYDVRAFLKFLYAFDITSGS